MDCVLESLLFKELAAIVTDVLQVPEVADDLVVVRLTTAIMLAARPMNSVIFNPL